jgi:hypothetical protein
MQIEPRSGFIHKDKIVYALEYELAVEPPSSLIVWLDDAGNSLQPMVQPAEKGKRMVTVKPGDAIVHNGQEFRVTKVAIYRALGQTPGSEIVG